MIKTALLLSLTTSLASADLCTTVAVQSAQVYDIELIVLQTYDAPFIHTYLHVDVVWLDDMTNTCGSQHSTDFAPGIRKRGLSKLALRDTVSSPYAKSAKVEVSHSDNVTVKKMIMRKVAK